MKGSDLLSHQLLLDLVNEHQVIQLKGLTGHAQQKTATVCECQSRPKYVFKYRNIYLPGQEMLTSRTVQAPFLFNVQEQTMMDYHSQFVLLIMLVLNG